MWSGLVLLGIGMVSLVSYQIGKMRGWDQWDKENEEFQK
jgi:hypothetical protein